MSATPASCGCGGGATPPTVSGIRIRELLAADYDRVLALWQGTEGMGLNESDTRPAIEAFLARNPGLSRVAETESGAELVGALLCGHDGRRGYLHHLAVSKAHRKRGIGSALVDACLADLRAMGIAKCNLSLFTDNQAGREFWLHEGWSVRGDVVMVQKNLLSCTPGPC